jgi:hypothetical protein
MCAVIRALTYQNACVCMYETGSELWAIVLEKAYVVRFRKSQAVVLYAKYTTDDEVSAQTLKTFICPFCMLNILGR